MLYTLYVVRFAVNEAKDEREEIFNLNILARKKRQLAECLGAKWHDDLPYVPSCIYEEPFNVER